MQKNTPSRPDGSLLPVGFVARQDQRLVSYVQLLERWNAKFNLVGRQDIEQLWTRHIEDALFLYSCLPAVTESSNSATWVLDAGTGGGLPGMVLAIADQAGDDQPDQPHKRKFLLLDRSERKIRFLTQVVAELALDNVLPLCADFTKPLNPEVARRSGNALAPEMPATVPVICARAVAPPSTLWTSLQHLLETGGEMLLAAGPESKQQLPEGVEVQWFADSQSAADRGVVKLASHGFRN